MRRLWNAIRSSHACYVVSSFVAERATGLRGSLRQGRRRPLWAAAALAGLAAGAVLIGSWLAAQPPDPDTAAPQRVAEYMLSRHFARLSPQEQRLYIEAALARAASLDSEQQRALRERMAALRQRDPEGVRERSIELWKNLIVEEARRYVDLPPDERDPWLAQRVAMWRALGGRGGDRPGAAPGERSPAPIDDRGYQRMVGFLASEVMPRSDPGERALVTILVRDAGRLAQARK